MQAPYTFGRFTFDPASVALFDEGDPVQLGTIELKILDILLETPGELVSKAELMSRVWGTFRYPGDNALHVHIAGLRKRLGDNTISTKRGAGYRFARALLPRAENVRCPAILPLHTGPEERGYSPLIGRDDDLQQVVQLLQTARLVSLTGPGGVGKTSLGLQAARQCANDFADGAWLAELSTLHDPKAAASRIAATLGLGLGEGSRSSSDARPIDSRQEYPARPRQLRTPCRCVRRNLRDPFKLSPQAQDTRHHATGTVVRRRDDPRSTSTGSAT